MWPQVLSSDVIYTYLVVNKNFDCCYSNISPDNILTTLIPLRCLPYRKQMTIHQRKEIIIVILFTKLKKKIQFSLKIHRKTRLVGKKLKELINDVQSVIRISNVIEEALKAN